MNLRREGLLGTPIKAPAGRDIRPNVKLPVPVSSLTALIQDYWLFHSALVNRVWPEDLPAVWATESESQVFEIDGLPAPIVSPNSLVTLPESRTVWAVERAKADSLREFLATAALIDRKTRRFVKVGVQDNLVIPEPFGDSPSTLEISGLVLLSNSWTRLYREGALGAPASAFQQKPEKSIEKMAKSLV